MDGNYLSTYLDIDPLRHLLGHVTRHDQSIALWRKSQNRIELVHYWELERITGIKKHYKAFYSVEDAKSFINRLLSQYGLSLEDMVEIWGTPQIEKYIEPKATNIFPDIPRHSLYHLFSSLMSDTELFHHDNIISLAVDGSPDPISSPDFIIEDWYTGCVSVKGKIDVFPVSSPGMLWNSAKKHFGIEEGSLMALGSAVKSEAYLDIQESVRIMRFEDLENAKWLNDVIGEISSFTQEDQGIKFNFFDPVFTEEENKIGMVVKVLHQMSLQMMSQNLDTIIEKYKLNPSDFYLSLSGGYSLNCPTNSYLMKKYGFKGFIAPPCVSDTGLALGIGLYEFYVQNPQFKFCLNSAYYGNAHATKAFLGHNEFKHFIKDIAEFDMTQALIDIKSEVVVWFDDRAEIGPRALGNRSLLADPRNNLSKERLNLIKKRQWWRPVAPIILECCINDWFEDSFPSPFMLQAFYIKKDKADVVPAVIHLDGSARIQTINSNRHQLLYKFLEAFYKDTDVPLFCNTSLNDKGEPIIDTIDEAFNFALRKGLSILYINGTRIELHNHNEYRELEMLSRTKFYKFSNEKERLKLLAENNPYNLSEEELFIYCTIGQLRIEYDITDKADAENLKRYARVVSKQKTYRNIMERFQNEL